MIDAADKVVADDEIALARFEEELRQKRIQESMRPYDPDAPVYCFDCGELVPSERLLAYPRTNRCVPCATEMESFYRRGVPA